MWRHSKTSPEVPRIAVGMPPLLSFTSIVFQKLAFAKLCRATIRTPKGRLETDWTNRFASSIYTLGLLILRLRFLRLRSEIFSA
jgi:hypothetical protein